MTALQFSDLQEALIYTLGNLASWWLVLVAASSVMMSIIMLGLGLARFLMSRRIGSPQRSNQ